MARGLTVLHTSDFQCGRPFVPRAADALVRLARRVDPDVVVAAGDLTQRAKVREFTLARTLLDRLGDVPVILTPGNHDVPLYRFWERLACPYRNWRRFAGADLDSVTRVEGATFVGLDSSAPRRAIVNGRLDERQLDFARRAFAESPEGDLRILVIHHHFVPVPGGEGGSPLPRASHAVRAFEKMRIDVVLGGHVHLLHLRTSADAPPPHEVRPVPLIACGTTTSSRGRGVEAGWNSLTVLSFDGEAVRVTPHRLSPDGEDFEPLEAIVFANAPAEVAEAAPAREGTG
jgi:DNA repair exonuclease SbcCD nuclease subunit